MDNYKIIKPIESHLYGSHVFTTFAIFIVWSCYFMCVLSTLYVERSDDCVMYMFFHTAICLLILLYMCPHTRAIYVSSYWRKCVCLTDLFCTLLILLYTRGGVFWWLCDICVLILLYVCPHTDIYVFMKTFTTVYSRVLCVCGTMDGHIRHICYVSGH